MIAAAGLRGLASSLLFGVTSGDPLTYLVAAAAFLAVALASVTIAARRAARVEPLSALRCE